jgi:hypothetical protein
MGLELSYVSGACKITAPHYTYTLISAPHTVGLYQRRTISARHTNETLHYIVPPLYTNGT